MKKTTISFVTLAVAVMASSCGEYGGGIEEGGSDAEEDFVYVEVEVDWQQDKDPFFDGDPSDEIDVFRDNEDGFDICFDIDQTDLENSTIFIHTADQFWEQNRLWYESSSEPFYPYYLGGISQLVDPDGFPIEDVWGLTITRPRPYNAWSLVCRDLAFAHRAKLLKTCCHELGHQLARLTHLCTAAPGGGLTWDVDNHNDPDCLMGLGEVSNCTGEDLLWYVHFCDSCLARLRRVQN